MECWILLRDLRQKRTAVNGNRCTRPMLHCWALYMRYVTSISLYSVFLRLMKSSHYSQAPKQAVHLRSNSSELLKDWAIQQVIVVWNIAVQGSVHHSVIEKAECNLSDRKLYRLILNLTFLFKTLELIVTQIIDHLSEWELLPELQSAYHATHFTETAVLWVLSDIFKFLTVLLAPF